MLQAGQRRNKIVGVFIVIALLLLNKLGQCETMGHNNDAGVVKANLAKNVEEAVPKSSPVAAEKNTPTATAKQMPNILEQKNTMAAAEQATNKKTVNTNSQEPTVNTKTQQAASPANPESSSSAFAQHSGSTIITSNGEEISDSLKAGFYFLVALSLSAVSFIVCKVYRLRLSRAERKYGVQGDRSTQELTPLPIAIEDAASDDEDQTLFEVHRQNIRIL